MLVVVGLLLVSGFTSLSFALLSKELQTPPTLFKNVQGPPEEFVMHKLPEPVEAALTSHSAQLSVYLEELASQNGAAKVYRWSGDIPVDTEEEFRVSIVGDSKTFLDQLKITFKKGDQIKKASEVVGSFYGLDAKNGAPSATFIFKNSEQGIWNLNIESSKPSKSPTKPSLLILIENSGPLKVYSNLNSYTSLRVDEEIGIVSRLFDSEEHHSNLRNKGFNTANTANTTAEHDRLVRKIVPRALKPVEIRNKFMKNKNSDMIINADLDIILPNGEEKIIPMHDDGTKFDNAAADSIYGATFKASQPGIYSVVVTMRGFTEEGIAFIRSTEHIFSVVSDKMQFKNIASVSIGNDDEMIDINLHASGDVKSLNGKKFKAYAEVHGTSISDPTKTVPVAFVTGMTIAQIDGSDIVLPLKLSAKWLSKANAKLPLVLKSAFIQDVDTSIPLCTADQIKVVIHNEKDANGKRYLTPATANYKLQSLTSRYSFKNGDKITETMLYGPRPATLKSKVGNGNKLVVSHGYCANGNPWSAEDFTDHVVFEDYEQNRSNDEFAQLLRKFSEDFDGISLVAHSQGGIASLHLHSFYWSSADNMNGDEGRLIQSVGSPYLGSGLAGSIASLGDIFGVGCGKNSDMTHDGASLWMATIPAASRKKVYFYTTQYKPWSWCNLGANVVLKFPNDGVTELEFSKLEGGNNMGHTEKQCHTVGMKYPPQCQDHNRNAILNDNAAR